MPIAAVHLQSLRPDGQAHSALPAYRSGKSCHGSTASNPIGALTGSSLQPQNNVQGMLNALEQDGLMHTLAEPNMTAVSGETAKFLAGG